MEITKTFQITEENLDDLMVAALEGGINYWAGDCKIISNPENKTYASEVVAYGGVISISEIEEDGEEIEAHELTREKLLKGVQKVMEWGKFATVEDLMDGHDAETADVIVQYALFDEIVYG